jgi:hypothetical protein
MILHISDISFDQVLSAAVTPLVLISGVGLILLSLVNRYNHAIDRTRQLYNENNGGRGLTPGRKKQVEHMYMRCNILSKSIGFLIFSVVCSVVLILVSVLELFISYRMDIFKISLLFVAIIALTASTIFFFFDVRLSMKALDIELGKND